MTQKKREEDRIRPPRVLLIVIAILLVVAAVAPSVTQALIPPEELQKMILVIGLPFIAIFVAIILGFIYLIFVLASRLNHRIPQTIYRPIEAIIIGSIVLGVVGMFQPFTFFGYQIAFPFLVLATLCFIAWSHITPRGSHHQQDIGPVDVDEMVPPDPAIYNSPVSRG